MLPKLALRAVARLAAVPRVAKTTLDCGNLEPKLAAGRVGNCGDLLRELTKANK